MIGRWSRGVLMPAEDREKWDYDHARDGQMAPHINQEPAFEKRPRMEFLQNHWPDIRGLEFTRRQ